MFMLSGIPVLALTEIETVVFFLIKYNVSFGLQSF